MNNYRITWSIDFEAESVEDAILQAWGTMLDPESIATWFKVEVPETGEVLHKDFYELIHKVPYGE